MFNPAHLPNVILAISDTYAAAVIRAAKRYAIKVPDNLMVVGFDNTDLSLMTTPSITTISQPRYQLGYTAYEILFERIASPNSIDYASGNRIGCERIYRTVIKDQ